MKVFSIDTDGSLTHIGGDVFRWEGCGITELGTEWGHGAWVTFSMDSKGDISLISHKTPFPSYRELRKAVKELKDEEN